MFFMQMLTWEYCKQNIDIKTEYELKEFFVLREPLDNIITRLENPKVFAFSQYLWNEKYQLELSRIVKELYPECLIVFGGPQVPDNPTKLFLENLQIDICVHGEGEEVFEKILLENKLEYTPCLFATICNTLW